MDNPMLWLAFTASLMFVWFENKCLVLAVWNRPPIFFSQSILWLCRLALTYGTLWRIWHVYGARTAAVAFATFYSLNKLTFHFFFNREVKRVAANHPEWTLGDAAEVVRVHVNGGQV